MYRRMGTSVLSQSGNAVQGAESEHCYSKDAPTSRPYVSRGSCTAAVSSQSEDAPSGVRTRRQGISVTGQQIWPASIVPMLVRRSKSRRAKTAANSLASFLACNLSTLCHVACYSLMHARTSRSISSILRIVLWLLVLGNVSTVVIRVAITLSKHSTASSEYQRPMATRYAPTVTVQSPSRRHEVIRGKAMIILISSLSNTSTMLL